MDHSRVAKAEREVLDLVRGQDEKGDFTLVISVKSGRWYVATTPLDQTGAQGDGESFAEAWHRQEESWA